MRTTSLLLALFTVVGCTEYEVKETNNGPDDLVEDGEPDIDVTPMEINFGDLEVGQSAELTQVVTIANVGTEDLHIRSVQISDLGAPFSIGAVGTVLLPTPGDGGTSSTEFTVTFTPETAGPIDVRVRIESDDPDEPVVEVVITGRGIAPIIEINPQEYDFGSLYVGCDATQEITITNVGNATLEVYDFTVNSGSTDLAFDPDEPTNGPLPWLLEPQQSVDVLVAYVPLDVYQDVNYLLVASNDPFLPEAMAVQQGQASFFGQNEDVFEQPINGAVDILFAVDWSCSMYDDLSNVENNFTNFITTLSGMDADYHVAVVTADNGCFAGPDNYLDNTMSETEQQTIFSTMLHGSSGSNTERAFMLLEAALQSSNIGNGGCNEDFYREDATLSLVGVTDEPEQSVNPYSYYVALFQNMKDDPDDVVIHAIAGDYPQGCGSASAGTGLYEATVATGGLFLSICANDFGTHLEALAEGSAADLTSFALTDLPVEETIEVRVDGSLVTPYDGNDQVWSYNFNDNTIDFTENYVPQGGSTIQINYAILGDCSQ